MIAMLIVFLTASVLVDLYSDDNRYHTAACPAPHQFRAAAA